MTNTDHWFNVVGLEGFYYSYLYLILCGLVFFVLVVIFFILLQRGFYRGGKTEKIVDYKDKKTKGDISD